jgi:hypothetical protein
LRLSAFHDRRREVRVYVVVDDPGLAFVTDQ